MQNELIANLTDKIKKIYEEGISLVDAEKLAAEFLGGMLAISSEMRSAELDVRMRKTGLKAVRAAIYLEAATKDTKKPSDVMLAATVDTNKLVQSEQDKFDSLEADYNELERIYAIFKEAHIYVRGISRGA